MDKNELLKAINLELSQKRLQATRLQRKETIVAARASVYRLDSMRSLASQAREEAAKVRALLTAFEQQSSGFMKAKWIELGKKLTTLELQIAAVAKIIERTPKISI